jgi:hypothetical protein
LRPRWNDSAWHSLPPLLAREVTPRNTHNMYVERVGVGSALMLAGLATPSLAPAADASGSAGPPQITWEAPPGCPNAESVAQRLTDALAGAPAELGAGWQVRGRITGGVEAPWRLVLTLIAPDSGSEPSNRRVLSAKHCDDLGDAAAVAIAIALGDAAAPDVSAAATAPTPLEPVMSKPPDARTVDTAPAAARPEHDSSVPRRLALAADMVLDSASLGGLAGGAAVEMQGWLARFGLGLYGLWLPPRALSIDARQHAEFSLLAGGLRACYAVPADWLSVGACVGGEIGALEANTEGLREGQEPSDLWLAPSMGLAFGGKLLGALGVHSRVEVLFPIRRQEYRVDLEQSIHRVPEATLRWSLGIDGDVLSR